MQMKAYLVVVYAYHPYKREFSYTVKANSFSTALRRGVQKFRKEDGISGKRIKEIVAKATALF